jgi:lipopolysaccharide/colanic/teichoic acid biosynthesis glycosyltransferase
LKRLFDIVSAATLLVLTAPLLLLIALAVRLTMGKPVLFRQVRPGLNERLFVCVKFRTMNESHNEAGQLLEDERRVTRLGKFLRRTSLDELPQLWNVLRGDLSLIGPRPLFESYLPYYTETERRRHTVRPGLTGWAQIHGRNWARFDERLAMDVWYVDHMSWHLDLRILWATIWIVLTQQGVTPNPDVPLLPLDLERSRSPAAASLARAEDR